MNVASDCERADVGKNLRRELLVAASCLAWAIAFAGAMQLIKTGHVDGALAWCVAAIPSLGSVWMFRAFTRYLRRIDELERQIQLQALAWAAGSWFVAVCSYQLIDQLGAPSLDSSTITAMLPILYAIAIIVGRWRYR